MTKRSFLTGIVIALSMVGPWSSVVSATPQQAAPERRYVVNDVAGDANGAGWNYAYDGGLMGLSYKALGETLDVLNEQVDELNGVPVAAANVASADLLGVAFSTLRDAAAPGVRATGMSVFIRTAAVPKDDLFFALRGYLDSHGGLCSFTLSVTGIAAAQVAARLNVGNTQSGGDDGCPPSADVTVALPAEAARISSDDPGVEVNIAFSALPAGVASVLEHGTTVLSPRVWATEHSDPRSAEGGALDKSPIGDPWTVGENAVG